MVVELLEFDSLLLVTFGDEFLKVVDLFVEVPVNVFAFGLSHFENGGLFGLEDFHFVFAEIKLLSGVVDFIFEVGKEADKVNFFGRLV